MDPFTYPLDLESLISAPISNVNLVPRSNQGTTTSSFTKQTRTHRFRGDHWELEITFDARNRAEAREIDAFISRLRGQSGSFTFTPDKNLSSPSGEANENPDAKITPQSVVPYLEFDGTEDHVDFGDVLDKTGDFTVETWILPDDVTVANQRIALKHNPGSAGWYLTLGDSGDGALEFKVEGLGQATINTSTDEVVNGEWQHVAAVFDSSEDRLEIFLNGESVASTGSATGTPSATSTALGLAGDPEDNSGGHFDGLVSELRLWSEARTQTEIQNNMDNQLNGTETNLDGYWRLEDGSGDATDEVGSNDGTLNGDALWVQLQGYKVHTYGWLADTDGQLNPGDYIEIQGELKRIVSTVDSNAQGHATVYFWPQLRSDPNKDEGLVLTDPTSEWEMTNNPSEEIEGIVYNPLTISARESF